MPRRRLDAINNTSASAPRPSKRAKAVAPISQSPMPSTPPVPPPSATSPSDPYLIEPITDTEQPSPRRRQMPLVLRLLAGLVILTALLAGSFELVYANKVLPGVSADGIYLGGLSRPDAAKRLSAKTTVFAGQVVTITHDDTNLRIPVSSLAAKYDTTKAADLAYTIGREGTFWDRVRAQALTLLGQSTTISTLKFDTTRLTPYLTELHNDIVTPVQNATLSFNDNHAQVTPAKPGDRLDLGRLVQLVTDRLEQTSSDTIPAPVYQLNPSLGTAPLQAAVSQIDTYLSGPITLTRGSTDQTVDQTAIISWIQVGTKPTRAFLDTLKLDDLYPLPPTVNLGLDPAALKSYVVGLAAAIDQTPQNAALAMQDGQLTVVQPSRNGVKLNQANTIEAITKALTQPSDRRQINLTLDTTTAAVNENNLDSLGIKEQISEGETYFPGSPSTRLTNVRAGARRFDGVLLKPGEEFSFGKLLGDVGPETGYVPELVILADHEERQYGGGLCQVSSTAFRAALNAGLPITQRTNHSFAISYYTWPYAAPGVDATIYYPSVDFKFVNDTGHYILMQTTMKGYDLKFDFFGTKTKTGAIRGPEFVTGTSDATKPSRTVFYRDILDLAGNITKTDTFYTNYKSSKDFPVTQQFN